MMERLGQAGAAFVRFFSQPGKSATTEAERRNKLIASIAVGIFTLGIIHAVVNLGRLAAWAFKRLSPDSKGSSQEQLAARTDERWKTILEPEKEIKDLPERERNFAERTQDSSTAWESGDRKTVLEPEKESKDLSEWERNFAERTQDSSIAWESGDRMAARKAVVEMGKLLAMLGSEQPKYEEYKEEYTEQLLQLRKFPWSDSADARGEYKEASELNVAETQQKPQQTLQEAFDSKVGAARKAMADEIQKSYKKYEGEFDEAYAEKDKGKAEAAVRNMRVAVTQMGSMQLEYAGAQETLRQCEEMVERM